MTLLPGFSEQLAERAERLAATHERRERRGLRRPHGRRLGLSIVVTGLALSGVAYASKGLWSPQLGDPARGTAKATATDLPSDQLRLLGVLRREQTELDRSAGSRMALRFSSEGQRIRTNGVRRLATGANGGVVVLVPFERNVVMDMEAIRRGEVTEKPPMEVVHDQLCLFTVDAFESSGVSCGTVDDIIAGKLTSGTSNPECRVAQQRRDFAKAQATERALAAREGRPAVEMQCDRRMSTVGSSIHWVGVVPDGVASVQIGRRPGARTAVVHDNLFQVDGSPSGAIWLDAAGRELSQRRADVRQRLGLS